ncbi:MAG: M28 family peptidase [Saprospiraceae bacterium]|nr:M28 family peptidase [Saprospiraceae bacterium]
MKKLLFILLILRGVHATAQQATLADFAETINTNDLRVHETILTSDSLGGRETGTEGNLKAARYIAAQFEKLGLPKVGDNQTYFQRMVYTNDGWNNIALKVNDHTYRHQFNFYALPYLNPMLEGNKIEASEVVFLGYGIDHARYSDYKKANVKGKVILINMGEPMAQDSTFVISKTQTASNWSKIEAKLAIAYQKGVKAVLFIDPKMAESLQANRRNFSRNLTGDVVLPDGKMVNSAFISPDIAKEIIGKNTEGYAKAREKCAAGKPRSLTLPCELTLKMDKFFKQLIGNNVMGFIEGSDPVLKNEIVIVSAHYDHLGTRGEQIYHGADDNGSGTSSVLEIAQALVEAKRQGKGTRRSVLCLLMTGEEKGLLGSKYYVTYPVFPLDKTVADVNIDMVGRVDEKYEKLGNPNYIYVIGADKLSQDLHDINEKVNAKYTKLTLDYTYNDENDPNRYYYRSDHYNFAEHGVPAIFYFNGTHDDYHQPTDTIDKINFDKMAKIVKLAFFTATEIANRDERLRITKKVKTP